MSTAQSTGDPQATRGARALVIGESGSSVLTDLDPNPPRAAERISEIIGGNLEGLAVAGGDWCGYCNEDGNRLDLRPNMVADAVARTLGYPFQFGDYLVGPVVFLGLSGVNEVDVPQYVIDLARAAGAAFQRHAAGEPR